MVKYLGEKTIVILLYIFVGLILIYLSCFIIDLIRILLFKLLRINNLISYLGDKLNKKLD